MSADDGDDAAIRRPDGTPRPSTKREFGWQGWLLVAAIAVAFVIVPVVIYLRPPALPFTVAYLILPLLPAVLLAMLAVWLTTQ